MRGATRYQEFVLYHVENSLPSEPFLK